MGCDGYREALSARLDAEEPLGERAAADLDAHLAACADCRRWLDDAAAVTRLARTGPAVAGRDVTEAVLPAAPGRGRARLAMILRMLLGAFGAAQVVLGTVQATVFRSSEASTLHGTTIDGAHPGHLWHESAAWNVAIGAAFLWVASRRGRPVGIVPILTVFIGALVLLSIADLVAGRVEVARLASHGFVLVGYLVVLLLTRTQLDLTPPRQHARSRSEWPVRRSADDPLPQNVVRLPDAGQPAARTWLRGAA